jgi:hypothetical protein
MPELDGLGFGTAFRIWNLEFGIGPHHTARTTPTALDLEILELGILEPPPCTNFHDANPVTNVGEYVYFVKQPS